MNFSTQKNIKRRHELWFWRIGKCDMCEIFCASTKHRSRGAVHAVLITTMECKAYYDIRNEVRKEINYMIVPAKKIVWLSFFPF